MKRLLALCLLLAPIGCADIPRDPEGTLERVRVERRFHVGIVTPLPRPHAGTLLDGISRATGARPQLESGTTEMLLARLETGKLDLVIGELDPASPWSKRVTLIPPLAERISREHHSHIVAAARNGENAWIGLLHREAERIRAGT